MLNLCRTKTATVTQVKGLNHLITMETDVRPLRSPCMSIIGSMSLSERSRWSCSTDKSSDQHPRVAVDNPTASSPQEKYNKTPKHNMSDSYLFYFLSFLVAGCKHITKILQLWMTDSSTAVKYYIMLFFLFETRAKYYKV